MSQSIVISGRGAHPGVTEGEALVSDSTLSGWDTFDLATGAVNEIGHPLHGQSVKDKVLVVRGARGSTGWGTQFLKLRVAGVAPRAMVFPVVDSRIGTASVVTQVPVVTDLDQDIFAVVRTGDRVRVDGDSGTVTILSRDGAGAVSTGDHPVDARALHHDARVVDTHNDLILLVDHFDKRGNPDHFGEFWLPELRAGGVDVQVLPVWVDEYFQSEGALRRTLLLIERIHALAVQYPDDVAVCLTAADIDAANDAGRIALVIALEGAHGIGQDPHLIRTLARVGVRVVSIAHFGRTFLADGSAFDNSSRGGLTPQGVEVFREMEQLGIVFDISHLGIVGVQDVLEIATRPFLATHSSCLVLTDVHRSLGDVEIKRIAELGGVVGIAAAVPWFIDPENPSVDRVVDHIEHVVDVAGIDHVGLGPDIIDDYFKEVWGGWPVHAGQPSGAPGFQPTFTQADILRPSDLPKITEAMLDRGFTEQDIRKVLGDNVLRVLHQVMGVPG